MRHEHKHEEAIDILSDKLVERLMRDDFIIMIIDVSLKVLDESKEFLYEVEFDCKGLYNMYFILQYDEKEEYEYLLKNVHDNYVSVVHDMVAQVNSDGKSITCEESKSRFGFQLKLKN